MGRRSRDDWLLGLSAFLQSFLGAQRRTTSDRERREQDAFTQALAVERERRQQRQERRYEESEDFQRKMQEANLGFKQREEAAEQKFRGDFPYLAAQKQLGASYAGSAGQIRSWISRGLTPRGLQDAARALIVEREAERQRILAEAKKEQAATAGGEATNEQMMTALGSLQETMGAGPKPVTTAQRLAAVTKDIEDTNKLLEVLALGGGLSGVQPALPAPAAPDQAAAAPPAQHGLFTLPVEAMRQLQQGEDARQLGQQLPQGGKTTQADRQSMGNLLQALTTIMPAPLAQTFAQGMNRSIDPQTQARAWRTIYDTWGIRPAPRHDLSTIGPGGNMADIIRRWNMEPEGPQPPFLPSGVPPGAPGGSEPPLPMQRPPTIFRR